ncbi:MAG TPA: tRNA (cytidine(34)-2'-O)-methyltransferase [Burkholderiaceae bacterium]|nr:tRNA (cytidine(34)-2'-O)-methyltransferase [Burkholderiaceae bacterium]
MFHIVLVSPEIPPNTGNVIRLSANTGTSLHLVRPLGFALDDARLRRAGLDYHEWATLRVHDSLAAALQDIGTPASRCFALSTHGETPFAGAAFQAGDVFVFGSETAGLGAADLTLFDASRRLRLPMMPNQRSLNLSNAVAVTVFEAWRQQAYAGAA